MYRPKAFAVDDPQMLHGFIRGRAFATLAVAVNGVVELAYAPVVLDADSGLGTIRFHLAKANPIAAVADGAAVTVSVNGPDAYISPDWYVTPGLVPTWNYVAIEGKGRARRLTDSELRTLLADLTADQESKLAPKLSWTMDKVQPERLTAMLQVIVGFAVAFDTLEGKFKLSQDKHPDDIAGAITGLKGRSDGRAAHVAAAMRRFLKPQ